jgi:hypothetical protein
MTSTILAPAAVLVLWSLIMLIWVAATRLPAMAKLGMDVKTAQPGGRGVDLDPVLPPEVAWKSHNYTHFMRSSPCWRLPERAMGRTRSSPGPMC